MKYFKWIVILCGIFNSAYSQGTEQPQKTSENSLVSESVNTNKSPLSKEIDPKSESPSKDPLKNKNSSNIIEIDPKQSVLVKKDPYPLEKYKGDFVKNIKDIQKILTTDNIKKVKASLEKITNSQKKNTDPLAFLLLGNVYDHLHMYDKSIQMYDDGLQQITPNKEETKSKKQEKNQSKKKIIFILNKSQVLRHWGKSNKSLELLETLSNEDLKKYPQIFLYKGLASVYLKDKNKIVVNFRKYLENAPKGKQARKVRRAIAWILLHSQGNSGGTAMMLANGVNKALAQQQASTERALQTFMDEEYLNSQNSLMESSTSKIKDKSLNVPIQDIEEGEDFNVVAD